MNRIIPFLKSFYRACSALSLEDQPNIGNYDLDDLTFTYVPEPAGLSALSSAAAALLARRRKTRGMESVSK